MFAMFVMFVMFVMVVIFLMMLQQLLGGKTMKRTMYLVSGTYAAAAAAQLRSMNLSKSMRPCGMRYAAVGCGLPSQDSKKRKDSGP